MTHQTEALAEDKIINLTQEVGECGATRVHQLGGDTLTIFKDNELFEFARKCAALSSQPPAPREALNELIWLIASDSYAISFQTMGQYRTALLKAARASLTATAGSTP